MKNKIILFFMLVFSVATLFAAGNKEQTKNNNSTTEPVGYVVPEKVPQRTVAGTIAVLEMLDYLGVKPVAIPNSKRKLDPKFDGLHKIGMPMTPDMEKIKQANPDFFITVNSLQGSLEPQLKNAKVEYVFLKTNSYTNFLQSMEYLGKVFKKESKAKEYYESIKAKVDSVLAKNKNKKAPKVLILFGTPRGMMIATKNSFVGSLVDVMGAENIWKDSKVAMTFAPINLELIKASNPDIILRMTHVAPEISRKVFAKEFANDFWSSMDAVKNGKVYDLNNENFMVSGNVRIPEALDDLNKFLYENK